MPHSRLGVFSHGGSLAEFLAGACVELGVWVRTGASSDFTPVDVVCRSIAAAVVQGEMGGCRHVTQPHAMRLDDLLTCFAETFDLALVGDAEFAARLASRAERDGGSASIRLAAMLEGSDPSQIASRFSSGRLSESRARCAGRSDRLHIAGIPKVFWAYAQAFRGQSRLTTSRARLSG